MKYQVLISALALEDVADIYEYITTSFNEPHIAVNMRDSIIDAIESLEIYPMRAPLEKDEPFHSQGIRKLLIKNYYIFYHIEEERVIITRVLYNRREWQDIL